MREVFLHQLHDHLKSLRFQVSLMVLLLFFVGNGVVYTWRMERLIGEIDQLEARDRNGYKQIKTLDLAIRTTYQGVNRPLGTEFIAEGGYDWFIDAAGFTPRTGWDTFGSGKALATNHWMEPFELVDWTLIVRIVLSFLCIVLAYNTVSGGLETGTMRLVLSNPLSRGRLLIGKILAHLVILMVATGIGTLISLLILHLNGAAQLNARVLHGYGMFLLGTTLYVSFFLCISVGISALARSSASSLVLLLLIWAVFSVVIPQASYLLGVRALRTGKSPYVTFNNRQNSVIQETSGRIERENLSLRGRELGKTDNYTTERRYARVMQDAQSEMDRLAKDRDNQQLQQYRVVKRMNLLSPGLAFQYTIEAFLGTGDIRSEHFIDQVWRYRDTLRDFIRTEDAADPDSPHILFLSGYISEKALDPNLVPRFRDIPLSLADGIAVSIVPITILILEAILSFLFAFWAFNRVEIAG